MFELVKTSMIELFDDRYATLSEVVVTAATAIVTAIGDQGERTFQYRDFDNTKTPEINGVWDPIVAMRWLSVVEGCFFTCSCLDD